MSDLKQFRQLAEDALQQGRMALTEERRKAWFRVAEGYRSLAADVERHETAAELRAALPKHELP